MRGVLVTPNATVMWQKVGSMVNPSDCREIFKGVTGYSARYDVTLYDGKEEPIFDEIYVRILEHIIFHEVSESIIEEAIRKLYFDYKSK